ncbi:MAG: MCE family protein [Jatrophihabitans sp.]
MPKESFAKVTKRRLLGVAFIAVVAVFISLSIAIYNKAFTTVVDVKLKANHIGNQLMKDSDVKIKGLIVGSVKGVQADGANATVSLAMMPNMVGKIPSNVTAQILPKTLFGEQYVSLVMPDQRKSHIKSGDVIHQDVRAGALEAQTVLDHLFPVLTAVQPADLNATLTAVSTALQGRGEKLGQTLVNLDSYMKAINPHTKKLVDDLKQLGQVALEYNDVAPDIFASLQNLQTSAKTVVQKRQNLDTLLTTGSDTSVVLQGFLDQNKQRLIRVSDQGAKVFPLLEKYSPEFSCLLTGISHLNDLASKTVYDHQIHLSATIDTNVKKYTVGQQPHYLTNLGPNCFGLPGNPTPTITGPDGHTKLFQIPAKYRCLNDGAPLTDDPCGKTGNNPSAAGYTALNSPQENALVNTLIAGELHTTPSGVPAAATVLAGPLLRGQQVVVK